MGCPQVARVERPRGLSPVTAAGNPTKGETVMAVEAYDFTVPQILPRPKMNDEWRVVNFRRYVLDCYDRGMDIEVYALEDARRHPDWDDANDLGDILYRGFRCRVSALAGQVVGVRKEWSESDKWTEWVADNEPQTVELPVERESVFVEFVNNDGMRTAVNRAMVTSVRIWPGASEQREHAWQVCIWLCADQSVRTPFTTDRAEADELFDRLTR